MESSSWILKFVPIFFVHKTPKNLELFFQKTSFSQPCNQCQYRLSAECQWTHI